MRVSRGVSRVFVSVVTGLLLGASTATAIEVVGREVSRYQWSLAERQGALEGTAGALGASSVSFLAVDITLHVETLDSHFTDKLRNAVAFAAGSGSAGPDDEEGETRPEDVRLAMTFPVIGFLAFETSDSRKIDLDAVKVTVATALGARLDTVSARIFSIDGRLAEAYAAMGAGASANAGAAASLGQIEGVDNIEVVDGFVDTEDVESVDAALTPFKPIRFDLTRVEYTIVVEEGEAGTHDGVDQNGAAHDINSPEFVFRRATSYANSASDAIFVDRIADAVGIGAEAETDPEVRVAINAKVQTPSTAKCEQAVAKIQGYTGARLLSAALALDGIDAVVDPVLARVGVVPTTPLEPVSQTQPTAQKTTANTSNPVLNPESYAWDALHDGDLENGEFADAFGDTAGDYSYGKEKVYPPAAAPTASSATVETPPSKSAETQATADVDAAMDELSGETAEHTTSMTQIEAETDSPVPETDEPSKALNAEKPTGVVTRADVATNESEDPVKAHAYTPDTEDPHHPVLDRYDEGFADGVEAGEEGKDTATARDLADGLNDPSRYADGYAAGSATSETKKEENEQERYQAAYAEGYRQGAKELQNAAADVETDAETDVVAVETDAETDVVAVDDDAATAVERSVASPGSGPGHDGSLAVLSLLGLHTVSMKLAREPNTADDDFALYESPKARRAIARVAYRAGAKAARDVVAMKYGAGSKEVTLVAAGVDDPVAETPVEDIQADGADPLAPGERYAAAKEGYEAGLQTADFALDVAFTLAEIRGARKENDESKARAVAALGGFRETNDVGTWVSSGEQLNKVEVPRVGAVKGRVRDAKGKTGDERRSSVFHGWAVAGTGIAAIAVMRARADKKAAQQAEGDVFCKLVAPVTGERYGADVV
jgi:hypothetical protein